MTENEGRKEVPRKKVKKKKRPESSQPEQELEDSPDVPTNVGGIDDDFDMPELPSEDEIVTAKEVQLKDEFPYDVAFNFGFIGIGQGGSRIAQAFWYAGYRRVAVIDGAHQDLQDVSEEIPRLDLETSGSAKDLSVGAASVQNRDEDLWRLMQDSMGKDVDYMFVCACLGGGTGSGAAPKVIEIGRRYMREIKREERVGCLVSLPTGNEGQRVCANALQTFGKLRQVGPAPMIIIDNQRIAELFRVGVTKLYAKCNEQIVKLLHLFNQLAAQRSQLITFDRAEFGSLLDTGIVTFGASPIREFGKASDVSAAVQKQLASTALAAVDLKTATGAGCIFVGNAGTLDTIPESVLGGGFDMCERMLREGGVLHRGVYIGNATGLRCLTLLAGLDPPAERLRALGAEARIPQSNIASYLGVDDGV